jgi:OOP family OmpA-OmpF porin
MEDLVDTVGHLIDGGAVKQMSTLVREDEGNTRRAFNTAVPVSIAGLASQAHSDDGARSLLQTLQSGRYPHLEPADLDKALSDPSAANLMALSGESFLSRMFGTRLDGVLDALAGAAGVSRASATKLLGLATPLVMSLVSKRAASEHLDAHGLAGFLGQQETLAAGYLPDRMNGLLGTRPEMVERPAARVTTDYGPRRAEIPYRGIGQRRSAWPWLAAALVALAALGWFATRNRRETVQELREPGTVPAPPVRVQAPPSVPPAETKPPVAPQAAGPAPIASVAQGAVGSFQQAVEHGEAELPQRFVVLGLEYGADSAALQPGTTQVLDDIASVMAAKPTVTIRAEGHTDATGSLAANQALATDRANAVKDYLVGQGIGADRITTAGFASPQPMTEIVLLQR